MVTIILDKLRRALSSVVLKIGLAAIFLGQAIVLTEGWRGTYDRWYYHQEFFLTRIDASVCVLIGAVFLFFATKQVLRGLFDRPPFAHEGETTTPMDRNPDDGPHIIWRRHDRFETVTDPDWWIQPLGVSSRLNPPVRIAY